MKQLTKILGVTIAQDAESRCLFTTWHGKHTGREKKACCTLIVQEVRQTGSIKILSDGSQDLDGWRDVVRWLGNDYYAELQASGVVALALVLPHNMKARNDLNDVLATIYHSASHTNDRIILDTFADIEAAYFWLQNI